MNGKEIGGAVLKIGYAKVPTLAPPSSFLQTTRDRSNSGNFAGKNLRQQHAALDGGPGSGSPVNVSSRYPHPLPYIDEFKIGITPVDILAILGEGIDCTLTANKGKQPHSSHPTMLTMSGRLRIYLARFA
jgi:hypothetical protein